MFDPQNPQLFLPFSISDPNGNIFLEELLLGLSFIFISKVSSSAAPVVGALLYGQGVLVELSPSTISWHGSQG